MAPYLLPHYAKRLCQTLCLTLGIGMMMPVFAQVDFTQGNTPIDPGPFQYGNPGQPEIAPPGYTVVLAVICGVMRV